MSAERHFWLASWAAPAMAHPRPMARARAKPGPQRPSRLRLRARAWVKVDAFEGVLVCMRGRLAAKEPAIKGQKLAGVSDSEEGTQELRKRKSIHLLSSFPEFLSSFFRLAA